MKKPAHHLLSAFAAVSAAILLSSCATNPSSGGSMSGNKMPKPAVSSQQSGSSAVEQAKVHTNLGQLYVSRGAYQIALEEANLALQADSSYAPTYALLGQTYHMMDQLAEANANFSKAMQLAPGDPEIKSNYAWFLCQTGRIRESYPHFESALNNPHLQQKAKVLNNRGICALLHKNDTDARQYLLRSLSVDANNLRAYYLMAEIEYRAQRYIDARQWLERLHKKIDPTSQTAWFALLIEKRLHNQQGVDNFANILRTRFRNSEQYQKLENGSFDE